MTHYPHQTVLRFGDAELAAVETTRAALSKVRGKDVPLSEAMRVCIRNRTSAARVEAMAMAMAASGAAAGPVKLDPELVAVLSELQRGLGYCQGSLNSLAKSVAYATKALRLQIEGSTDDATLDALPSLLRWSREFEQRQPQVAEALEAVFTLRRCVDAVEHRLIGRDVDEEDADEDKAD